mgnify:FL=1
MNTITPTIHSLNAAGDHSIPIYLWLPDAAPKAVIQLFHGLGEHVARYERFAQAAMQQGYVVAAHNHRGHGPETEQIGFFAHAKGWELLVDDGHRVFDDLQQQFPGLPVVLLGHSMGSYIAQAYAMQFGQDLAALVLSGSTWPSRPKLIVGRLLARLVSWRHGLRDNSPLLDKLGFGEFNRPFKPARTDLDWLSRDPDEVDAYINDPLCGGPYTVGLWIDLLGGLLQISKGEALRQISSDLPILITGGSDDPVGGEAGMTELAASYEASGHHQLSTKIYAGGRHEMLNETNRDEFTADVLRWIAEQLARNKANHQA